MLAKAAFFDHHHCHRWCKELTANKSPWGCHHVILSSCCADSIEQKQWGWSWIISHSRLLSQRYWTMKPENHFAAQWAFDQNLCTLQCNFREHENQGRAGAGNNFLSVLQRKRGSFLKNVEFCLLVAKWNIAANSRQADSLPSNHPLKFQFESKIERTTAKTSIPKGRFFSPKDRKDKPPRASQEGSWQELFEAFLENRGIAYFYVLWGWVCVETAWQHGSFFRLLRSPPSNYFFRFKLTSHENIWK